MAESITRRDFLKQTSKAAAAAGLTGWLEGCRPKQEFDLVIKGGLIYDGRGSAPYRADIGIDGMVIGKIGKITAGKAVQVISAENLTVCPGFIDAHDHSDIGLLVNPKTESHIRQGITTLVSGNCGNSPFPVSEDMYERGRKAIREEYGIEVDWRDIGGFFSSLEAKGLACNYATLVGHGSIRGAAMGFDDRPPTPEELEKMKDLCESSIRNGAIGLSTGLEYTPGSSARADEITALCRVAADLGGVYASHMRSEGDFLLESLEETIEVGRQTGIPLQISHFKGAYPRNWQKVDAALTKIEEARDQGISLYCDRYPYVAGSTGLSYNFPLWAREGTTDEFLARLKDPAREDRLRAYITEREEKLGSWDKVVITTVFTEKNKVFEGKSVMEGAAESGKDAFAFMRDLLIEEEDRVGMVIFMMKEENLKKILSHPLVGIGCDGSALAPYGILSKGKPHPRNYGTFPRVLGKYVREEKILPMAEMIKKMTSLPAKHFGFEKRGVIETGSFADIVIFDSERVIDRATWKDPHQYPEGIPHVIVNGQAVILEGEHTGSLPGKILRKQVSV